MTALKDPEARFTACLNLREEREALEQRDGSGPEPWEAVALLAGLAIVFCAGAVSMLLVLKGF